VTLYDVAQRRELCRLVTLAGDDWQVVAPDGLFDGAPDAWAQVLWRLSPQLADALPVEAFFTEYFYPNLLGDLLTGQRPAAPAGALPDKDRRQPIVQLSLDANAAAPPVKERRVKVRVTVADAPAGARDVRLFRNGLLVKAWPGEALAAGNASVALETELPLVAGENRLTAYAFNRTNVKSVDAALTVNGANSLARQGVLRVLAVGVGRYANAAFNLGYTPEDARAVAAEVARQQERLGQFERVETVTLIDAEATKANLLRELQKLAAVSQPEDGALIYFSGHGTAQGNRFYLIPHDLGYAGPRRALNAEGLALLLAHSVSDEELETALRGLDANQLLLVVDACNSGQALNADDKRRGPMNARGLAQLAYEKGMSVLTASQDVEEAFVSNQLRHSYLTYALVEEGLKARAADTRPADGTVSLREWFDYAARRVPKLRGEKLQGKDITEEGGDAPAGQPATRPTRTQTPRVFYRREPLYARPLVMARQP
jgi:hypothetical protein